MKAKHARWITGFFKEQLNVWIGVFTLGPGIAAFLSTQPLPKVIANALQDLTYEIIRSSTQVPGWFGPLFCLIAPFILLTVIGAILANFSWKASHRTVTHFHAIDFGKPDEET